jgi:protein-disulfide isomerase
VRLFKSIFFICIAAVSIGAAHPNWTTTVGQTASGAFVMGNPNAKVRLVEFISYTCSHCAAFVGESAVPLKRNYVAKGLVAVELRNAVLNPLDYTAAVIARCGGGAKFFGNTETLMAAQPVWTKKAFDYANAHEAEFKKGNAAQIMARFVTVADLAGVMKKRGFTPAQINACAANKVSQAKVLALTKNALEVHKIEGTPTFMINGQIHADAHSWADVQPLIDAALGKAR